MNQQQCQPQVGQPQGDGKAQSAEIRVNVEYNMSRISLILDPDISFSMLFDYIKEFMFGYNQMPSLQGTIQCQLQNGDDITQQDERNLTQLGFTNECTLKVYVDGQHRCLDNNKHFIYTQKHNHEFQFLCSEYRFKNLNPILLTILPLYDRFIERRIFHLNRCISKSIEKIIQISKVQEIISFAPQMIKYLDIFKKQFNELNQNSTLEQVQEISQTIQALALLIDQRKYEKAFRQCYEAISSIQFYFKSLSGKARCLQMLGEEYEALKYYDEALQINEKHPDAFFNKGSILFHWQGQCLKSMHRFKETIDQYDKRLQLDPKFIRAYRATGCEKRHDKINQEISLTIQALSLIDQGKYEEALTLFEKAISINQFYFESLSGKARCLYMLGEEYEALKYYDKALQINEKHPDAFFNKGSILFHWQGQCLKSMHRFKEAIDQYDKCLQLDPKFIQAYRATGCECLYLMENYYEAIDCYQKAQEIDEKDLNILLGMGECLRALNRMDEAIICIEAALEIDPNNDESLIAKGFWLTDQKKFKEAILWFQKALQINPKHPTALRKKQHCEDNI